MEIKSFIGDVDRRKLTIVTILCMVLIAIVVLVVSLPGRNECCQFQYSEPEVEIGDSVETMIAPNFEALLRLSSYFTYHNKSDRSDHYLAQKVDGFTLEKLDDPQLSKLTIHMNCSKVTMHLRRNIYSDLYSDKIEFDLAIVPEGGFEKHCEITDLIKWSNSSEHYNCYEWDFFDCWLEDSKDTISWVVGTLEFETDGDKDNTRKGEWSSRKSQCRRRIG